MTNKGRSEKIEDMDLRKNGNTVDLGGVYKQDFENSRKGSRNESAEKFMLVLENIRHKWLDYQF